jgi:hypothetical protein
VVAAGIMEYSRHKEGEPDARGTRSMMEIHADAQRQAMQEAGLGALRRLVPKASAPTCLAALEATGWNADEAYKHLKAFLEVEEKAKKDAAADAKREEKKRKREASKKSRRDESPFSERRIRKFGFGEFLFFFLLVFAYGDAGRRARSTRSTRSTRNGGGRRRLRRTTRTTGRRRVSARSGDARLKKKRRASPSARAASFARRTRTRKSRSSARGWRR